MSSQEAASASTSIGGYDVLHQLKAGGMGEVLLARKLGTGGFDKLVAIKTIRSDLRKLTQLRPMFLDEAKLMSRLSHSAVAQVHDFGEDAGTLYLVMEYVAGVSFAELTETTPPAPMVARAVAEACRGLHAAHNLKDIDGTPLGIVHRDVTPENLMLSFDGRVKILDFGIALMEGRQAPVTEFGTVKGKPPYLSPEQVTGQAVDYRTDIFSICVVLYELLTGHQLFTGESIYEVAKKVQEAEVVPPSFLNPSLPSGFDEAVMRGLERNPTKRWDNALALARVLESLADEGGASSLARFSEGHLREERETHEIWLRALLTKGAPTGTRGRPSGVLTVPGEELSTLENSETLPESEVAVVPGRPVWHWLAALALTTALLGVAFVGLRGPLGQVQADAAAPAGDAAQVADARPTAVVADARAMMDAGAVDAARPDASSAKRERRTRRPSRERRPPPPPPPPPEVQEYGFLSVNANPFAAVYVDGKSVGQTPIVRMKLTVGPHRVVLKHGNSNEIRKSETVNVQADKVKKITAR